MKHKDSGFFLIFGLLMEGTGSVIITRDPDPEDPGGLTIYRYDIDPEYWLPSVQDISSLYFYSEFEG
jgi:hypothetical protein